MKANTILFSHRNNKDIQLSKSLSWLLRHGAVREGFEVSSDGYIEVARILNHKSFKGKYNLLDIERVVQSNDKQRFKLRSNPNTNVLEIKAHQGHSISEVCDADLKPIIERSPQVNLARVVQLADTTNPKPKYGTVVHGTYLKCWPQIKAQGLSRMKRKHIHLAKGTPEDNRVISGMRQNAQVYIYVNLAEALSAGLSFYESENGVILTSGNVEGYLEPTYFSKVVKASTGEQLYP